MCMSVCVSMLGTSWEMADCFLRSYAFVPLHILSWCCWPYTMFSAWHVCGLACSWFVCAGTSRLELQSFVTFPACSLNARFARDCADNNLECGSQRTGVADAHCTNLTNTICLRSAPYAAILASRCSWIVILHRLLAIVFECQQRQQ